MSAARASGAPMRAALLAAGLLVALVVPAAAQLFAPDPDDVECPAIDVFEGGSAIRNEAGGAVRSQISIGQTARECRVDGDVIRFRIGVQGRALLGQAGAPGTFGVAMRFSVRRGDKVLATRVQRTSVTIPSGDTQAAFALVEEGLSAPRDAINEIELVVGFDRGGAAAKPVKKRRR